MPLPIPVTPGSTPGLAAVPSGTPAADFLALLSEFVTQTVPTEEKAKAPGEPRLRATEISREPVPEEPDKADPERPKLHAFTPVMAMVAPPPDPAPLPMTLNLTGGETEEDTTVEAESPAPALEAAAVPAEAVPAAFTAPVPAPVTRAVPVATESPRPIPVATPEFTVPAQSAPDLKPEAPAIPTQAQPRPQLQPRVAAPERPAGPLAFALRLEPVARQSAPAPVEPKSMVEAAPVPRVANIEPKPPVQAEPQTPVQAPVPAQAQPVKEMPVATPEAVEPVVEGNEKAPAREQTIVRTEAGPVRRTPGKAAEPETVRTRDAARPVERTEEPLRRPAAERVDPAIKTAGDRERVPDSEPAPRRKITPDAAQPQTAQTRPALEMHSEPGPAPVEAAGRTAPFEPEPAPQLRAPGTATEISLQVSDSGRENVQVRLVERSGEVHVAVRAGDERVAESLRSDLDRLSKAFDQQGYQAETWQPVAGVSSDPRQEMQHRQGGNADAWNDASEQGQKQQQDARQQGQRRDTPRWVAELEEKQRGDFRSDFKWLSQQ